MKPDTPYKWSYFQNLKITMHNLTSHQSLNVNLKH